MFVHLYYCCSLYVEGLLKGDSTMRDVHLSAAQHDGFSQDLCPVPLVEQHDVRGQLTTNTHIINNLIICPWLHLTPCVPAGLSQRSESYGPRSSHTEAHYR